METTPLAREQAGVGVRYPLLWLVAGLSGLGVAISVYLVRVALDPAKEIACGPLGDCHTVQNSQYAEVAGIPVAVLGLGMYVALLGLVGLELWGRARGLSPALLEALPQLRFAMALGGVLYSGYLTYLELAVIDAICAWCVTSAVLVTIIFVLSLGGARGGRGGTRDVS